MLLADFVTLCTFGLASRLTTFKCRKRGSSQEGSVCRQASTEEQARSPAGEELCQETHWPIHAMGPCPGSHQRWWVPEHSMGRAAAPFLLWWQPAETPCWLALDGGSSIFSSGGIVWSHSASHSMKHLQGFKGIYSLQPQWDERSAGFLVWRQRGRSWVLQPGKNPEETKERPCTASSK